MDLDDLRIIVWNERESGKLSDVPAELFATGRAALKDIQHEIHAIGDPFSEEGAVLQDRYHSIKETLSTIVKLRLKKILRLAEAQIEGGYLDRDEVKTMLPQERAMFDAVRREIALCRDQMLEGAVEASAPAREVREIEEPELPIERQDEDEAFAALVEESLKEEERQDADSPEGSTPADTSLVLVTAGIPPFMGLDGRTYALEAGDLVTLPRENAGVLNERNIALNIRLIK